MSGDPTLRRPRSLEWQDGHYESVTTALGLHEFSPTDRAERLTNMSAKEMVRGLPAFMHWSPTIDGEFIKEEITIGQLHDPGDKRGKPTWLKGVVAGDMLHDVRGCPFSQVLDLQKC